VNTAVQECTSTSTTTTVTQAYRYALDPTSEQANLLRSHIGGSRFCYNTLLGLVKTNWDENRARKESGEEVPREGYLGTSHFDLLYLWSAKYDEVAPWWGENGSSTYNDAAQRLSKAFANWKKGTGRVPTFKSRGRGGSVRFTNTAVRLTDSHHVRVSRIGEVKTYESTRKMYRHLERGTGRILAATVSQSAGSVSTSASPPSTPGLHLPANRSFRSRTPGTTSKSSRNSPAPSAWPPVARDPARGSPHRSVGSWRTPGSRESITRPTPHGAT
jgi:putative transposase